jgi:hypothetical protein
MQNAGERRFEFVAPSRQVCGGHLIIVDVTWEAVGRTVWVVWVCLRSLSLTKVSSALIWAGKKSPVSNP